MKKILLTTIHPAPYIDMWIKTLSDKFEVDILYKYSFTGEKEWKNYVPKEINLYSDYSFFQKIKLLKKYDLVILCSWGLKENIFLSLALIPFKTKVSFFLDHPIIGQSKTSLIAKFIKMAIMKSADYIFPASESCLNYLNLNYSVQKSKMNVFTYALAYRDKKKCIAINKVREERIKDGDSIRIFIANRFEERKGYKILLEAFKELNRINLLNNFEIVVAGSGNEFLYYKHQFDQLKSNIKFLGWIENEVYNEEMEKCDVYIHASIFEPFGIPPLDALQCGKNIIVSDGVKSCDYLNNNNLNGVHLYPANNTLMLVEEMTCIVKNKLDLYKNASSIIENVNKQYSIDVNVNTINNIWSK